MPAPAFEIDTVVMTAQPSNIKVEEAEGKYTETIDGGYLVSPRSKGALITVTWGVQAAKDAVVSELRTKRGSTYAHVIEFIDVNSVVQTFNVLIPPISYEILLSEHYNRLTLRMRERP